MERQTTGLELALGEEAPYFSLKGTDEKIHTISDYKDKQALVVLFSCNHCPYVQAYDQRLIELANRFQPQGAQFVAICANDSAGYPEDDFENMVKKSIELALPFPYLCDETQQVAKAYDAQCTPEAYLFDADLCLRYHGRIDDNYKNPANVERHELEDALVAVLAGKEVKEPLTPAIGCSIKWRR